MRLNLLRRALMAATLAALCHLPAAATSPCGSPNAEGAEPSSVESGSAETGSAETGSSESGSAEVLVAPVNADGAELAVPAAQVKAAAATPNYPRRSNMQRAVHFESTRNTRDLGGLPRRGGYISNGILFRSGALCYATASDKEAVARLNLRTVVDLRSPREINEKEGADRLPAGCAIKVVNLPMFSRAEPGLASYHSYALDNDASVRGFFELLAEPRNLPLLYHCSGGKDRTGVLTALLLELLGTPRSFIMDDYLQSQRNSAGLIVKEAWLNKLFATIDGGGGIVRFLQKRGISAETLRRVQENVR